MRAEVGSQLRARRCTQVPCVPALPAAPCHRSASLPPHPPWDHRPRGPTPGLQPSTVNQQVQAAAAPAPGWQRPKSPRQRRSHALSASRPDNGLRDAQRRNGAPAWHPPGTRHGIWLGTMLLATTNRRQPQCRCARIKAARASRCTKHARLGTAPRATTGRRPPRPSSLREGAATPLVVCHSSCRRPPTSRSTPGAMPTMISRNPKPGASPWAESQVQPHTAWHRPLKPPREVAAVTPGVAA